MFDTHQQNAAASAPFRFRDLPEELQAQIIRACLTEWSYVQRRETCRSCTSKDAPRWVLYRVAHPSNHIISQSNLNRRTKTAEPEATKSCYGTSVTSIQLVDHNMRRHCRRGLLQKFTGQLYVDDGPASHHEPRACRASDLAEPHQHVSDCVTTVHFEADEGFRNLGMAYPGIAPNVKMAIARCRGTLFDGPIYGFGEESFFVRVISEEKLKSLMLSKMQAWKRSPYYPGSEHFRAAGIKTVVEMVVAMGSPPMRFQFMCIFLLEGLGTEPVVLGKFTMHEWNLSVRHRISVYRANE